MDRELKRYRYGAIVFLLVLICGMLIVFTAVTIGTAAAESDAQDIRDCQMALVVNGASPIEAEMFCGEVG